MADEIIRPYALPNRENPVASEKVPVDNGSTVGGATIEALVLAGRPTASQVEAEAGVNALKAMTPLTTKQAIDQQVPPKIAAAIGDLNLGSAAQADTTDFATAAQGSLADSAVQPGDLATVATTGSYTDLTDKPTLSDETSAESRAWAISNLHPISAPTFIRTAGYGAPGDGGGALYKLVVSEPSHPGKFSITLDDGVTVAWYEIAEQLRAEVEAPTIASAQDQVYAEEPRFIRTAGRLSAGDGNGFIYKGVASEPAASSRNYAVEGEHLASSGTAIGNMTAGGGLAAAFDGNLSKVMASAARGPSSIARFVGRTLAAPFRIASARIWGTSDQGVLDAANTNVTLSLYAKQGAAPGSATDGVLLGSISFIDQNAAIERYIPSSDVDTLFDHVWVVITGDGVNNVGVSQVRPFRANRSTYTSDPEKVSITPPGGGIKWFEGVQPSQGHSVAFDRTPDDAELVTELPLAQVGTNSMRRVVLRLPVYLEVGDLLECTGEAEFSSNEGSGGANIGVWSMIGLASSPGQVTFNPAYEVTESNGRNITPAMHHDTHVHAGAIIAPATGVFYVNFVAWCASTSATTTEVTVEQDYGHLTVKRTRGQISGLLQ